ncbi:unnamed protein product (macronuclear) [Paramecium tetraurelia]|uniref:Uncharacterized protein n=1 Tax=Paramecium tetraurelia TaxID=5888 RepID=A0DDX5_PARTE|nr:uncharacterized protein GSPATT00016083001 [Paramecium tetraurelia]CAK81242.1 unnamed protein product [Paramecium tetraurelia]|eukprot:XP_001448639.1 hypothetical protein (macronuclear) [Paramecium tetraurelia strain d4-2]
MKKQQLFKGFYRQIKRLVSNSNGKGKRKIIQFIDVALIQRYQMGGKLDFNQIPLVSIKESNSLCVKPAESIDLDPQGQKIDPLELLIQQC